jgi:hypothetical protein
VRRGEKALLAVLNLERKPAQSTVKLNLAELGFKEAFAQDAVTGEDLAMENGSLKLDFTPEGFRAVKITAAKEPSSVPEKIGANLISEIEPDKWPAANLPSGWTGQRGGAVFENGQLVLPPGAHFVRTIQVEKGKTYVLEAETRVECDDGAFLGQEIQFDQFRISLGGGGRSALRSLSSQLPPGKYQTLRAVWTAPANDASVDIAFNRGKGKVLIKRIGMYEANPR